MHSPVVPLAWELKARKVVNRHDRGTAVRNRGIEVRKMHQVNISAERLKKESSLFVQRVV
jgi:hypothetical protein